MSTAWHVRPAQAQAQDIAMGSALRGARWPDVERADEPAGISEDFVRLDRAAFMAIADGTAIGLAEAGLRHDYVNGAATSPVAFPESRYARPDGRGRGVGRARVDAGLGRAREQDVHELDAAFDDAAALRAHAACGFDETGRVVFFRRRLD